MRDSRETKVNTAFVAGYPIRHSRSPLIHGHWLRTHGLDGAYLRQEITPADFAPFIAGLKRGESSFVGGNVTIPHKEQALLLADHPDELSRELGAANTLWLEEGRLLATNTDGYGFVSNLDQRAPEWDQGATALVLGAGGASRAVVQALRDRGFRDIRLVNRTVSRARELADRFGASVEPLGFEDLEDAMDGANLFVNTTSLGMEGAAAPELDFSGLAADAIVTDIVYVPLETPFLQQARSQGRATVDGLGMLLHQAVPGFEKWFGVRPEVTDALRQMVIDDMAEHA